MYVYTIRQWLLFFFVYCFFGWIFESSYVSLKKRRFVNRGFMHGPFLPLYGSGAILILFVTLPVRKNYLMMYFAGAVAATILEYFTGVVMERMFKVRYWDYSNNRFQFQGHICLGSSIAWGFLSVLLVEVIHKPIEQLIMNISAYGYLEELLVFGITIYFVADFTISFREAYEFRDLLLYLERAREDAERIKRRVEDEISQKKEEFREKSSAYVEAVEGKMEFYKNRLTEHNTRAVRRFFESHPSAASERFKTVLGELREHVKNIKK